MRSTLRLLLIVALAAAIAMPAAADADVLKPCDTENTTVGLDDLTTDFDTPLQPIGEHGQDILGGTETATFTLDLAGQPADQDRARVDVTLFIEDTLSTLGAGASDFELYVNGGASTTFNPTDGATEFVGLGNTLHCTDIVVTVENYAGDPSASLSLNINVK